MTLYEMHCDFTLKYDNVLTTNTSPLYCTLIKNYFLVSRQNFDMYKQLETGQGVLNRRLEATIITLMQVFFCCLTTVLQNHYIPGYINQFINCYISFA